MPVGEKEEREREQDTEDRHPHPVAEPVTPAHHQSGQWRVWRDFRN